MNLFLLIMFTLTATSAEAMDTRVKCRPTADQVVRALLASPALRGDFSGDPSLRLQWRVWPDNDSELWESFTYSNGRGGNSITVKLARGLCDLREISHHAQK